MSFSRYSMQSIGDDDIDLAVSALKSGTLTGGEFLDRFEKALCDYTGASYAVCFSSATAALHASYAVCGIGSDDEVIVPAITFAATANALLFLGAKPIFCDINFSDGLIDVGKIEALITPKTKAIVPVHYAGSIANMEAIRSIAQKHNLIVIEDAAHSLGSFCGDRSAGGFGALGVFSFHPVKPITTGEGGAVVTDSAELAEKLLLFRSHGIVKKTLWSQDMVMLGNNYRLNEMSCALGVSQLAKLDGFIAQREKIAQIYIKAFHKSPIFTLKAGVESRSSRHLFPVLLDRSLWCTKEEIFTKLVQANIGVQVHYKPVYKHSYYQQRYPNQSLLMNSEEFYSAELSLPCHQQMSEDEAWFVADKLMDIVSSCKSGCHL